MWVCVRSVDRPQLSAPAEAPLHQVCDSVSLADEEPGPAPLLSPGTAMVLSGHHCARGPIIHSSLWPGSSYSGVCLPPLCCYFISLSAYCVLVTCSRAGACEKHEEQGGLCTHTHASTLAGSELGWEHEVGAHRTPLWKALFSGLTSLPPPHCPLSLL